jgi:hypothetical protein
VPQARPAQAVQAEIDTLKNERRWTMSSGCTDVTTSKSRTFCEQYNTLTAEFASAEQRVALEQRIAAIQAKLATAEGATVMSEADPQAAVLAKLAGAVAPSIKLEDVQTALTVFIALLLEVGSAFGMFIAFSQWRLYDRHTPAAPRMAPVSTAAAAVAAQKAVAIAKPRSSGANDNRTAAPAARLMAPETDVERFYKERIETQDGSSLTATSLYEDYCAWCEDQQKEPLALPTFGREFGELGVQKARIAGRVRYIGIALKSAHESSAGLVEDKKLPALGSRAA